MNQREDMANLVAEMREQDAALLAADIAQALYEAAPFTEGGEHIDGFLHTPDQKLSWTDIIESGMDEIYREMATAILRKFDVKPKR